MSTWQSGKFSVAIVSVICLLIICSANAQLSANYYASSCPRLQRIVRSALTPEVRKDRRLGASLLRMHFHDCFVNVSFYLHAHVELDLHMHAWVCFN